MTQIESLQDAANPVMAQELDLEQWREKEGLTYAKLAEVLDISTVAMAWRYANGEARLSDERIEYVLQVTNGEVSTYALHRRRMQWLRAKKAAGVAVGTIDQTQSL